MIDKYYKTVTMEYRKKLGQFFTPDEIAKFMSNWVSYKSTNILDPALGNSIFFKYMFKSEDNLSFSGYEIDKKLLNFFGNKYLVDIYNEDFLLSSWTNKYDGIVCNPPYNRFQSISNRKEILSIFKRETGIEFSGYTNQYILFLIKSIYQLEDNGRLAFLIPSEFLNSQYGVQIKEILIEKQLLKAIINFKNDSNIFDNATTTSCILLLEDNKDKIAEFISINKLEELAELSIKDKYLLKDSSRINYSELKPEIKWNYFMNNKKQTKYNNLVSFSQYADIKRGIATGNNNFFVFNKSKMNKFNLDERYLSKCISRSADIESYVFDSKDFIELYNEDKKCYILNVDDSDYIDSLELQSYIKYGLDNKMNDRYLLNLRTPWFSMETREPSPIWISSASRETIKVVRNIDRILNLTTFHSIYPLNEEYINILFCYLISSIGQKILKRNKKTLGNGLNKFQPNDLKNGKILDLKLINKEDKETIHEIYEKISKDNNKELINKLDNIFLKYLLLD